MDTPGQETAEQLRKKYAERGYEISQEKPRIGKDWNEYLQKGKRWKVGDELSNINRLENARIYQRWKNGTDPLMYSDGTLLGGEGKGIILDGIPVRMPTTPATTGPRQCVIPAAP